MWTRLVPSTRAARPCTSRRALSVLAPHAPSSDSVRTPRPGTRSPGCPGTACRTRRSLWDRCRKDQNWWMRNVLPWLFSLSSSFLHISQVQEMELILSYNSASVTEPASTSSALITNSSSAVSGKTVLKAMGMKLGDRVVVKGEGGGTVTRFGTLVRRFSNICLLTKILKYAQKGPHLSPIPSCSVVAPLSPRASGPG